jgi:hypothetical protein
MSVLLILGCGIAVFVATAVASFPFGFIQEFAAARGHALSDGALALLRLPEHTLEFGLTLGVLGTFATRNPEMAYMQAFGAVIVAACISFLLEVRKLGMSLKRFWVRFFVGAFVCVPIAISLGGVRGV